MKTEEQAYETKMRISPYHFGLANSVFALTAGGLSVLEVPGSKLYAAGDALAAMGFAFEAFRNFRYNAVDGRGWLTAAVGLVYPGFQQLNVGLNVMADEQFRLPHNIDVFRSGVAYAGVGMVKLGMGVAPLLSVFNPETKVRTLYSSGVSQLKRLTRSLYHRL